MKKILPINLFFYLIVGAFLTSCVTQKRITYFQKNIGGHDTMNVAQAYVPKIQQGDILSITVGSLNPAASSFFNPFSSVPVGADNLAGGGSGGLSNGVQTATNASGFLVDSAGIVELPLIGAIKVAGLTTSTARDTIKNRLKIYLKEPTVNVRFLNYKISVIGEVTKPSVYVIPNERITLPEALSIAGDLTPFGRRDNILVIRDVDGKKVFGHVDLSTREVYNSPYYYLHANDVVYIEPSKDRTEQASIAFRIIPIALSAISVLVIALYYSKH
ncbi:polysaccharide biosynthesis/export family protein [Mucilaginibacter sp. dw_454]|uniref:polysaccharide biosynthesis/export family protein n=1 Tax=Mucilaginibacter sp. dw_454 TaxID=2720079 RepID=UPI001BD2C62C|nr:polysaccharide biosynthesis/export family protein [Mucilaginibacter sp. dw_454]